jgi:hypothetical protein
MNETFPQTSSLQWPDLPVVALRSRVSSMVDRYSLQMAGRECARLCFLADALAGLVYVQFTMEPNDQVLLAVGRVLHEHLRTQQGRTRL